MEICDCRGQLEDLVNDLDFECQDVDTYDCNLCGRFFIVTKLASDSESTEYKIQEVIIAGLPGVE